MIKIIQPNDSSFLLRKPAQGPDGLYFRVMCYGTELTASVITTMQAYWRGCLNTKDIPRITYYLGWAVHEPCEGFGLEDLAEAFRAVYKEVEIA